MSIIEIIIALPEPLPSSMKILDRDCAEFLVIDDDSAITAFLSAYLKQKGHTCATLNEGFQTANWLEIARL